MSDVSVPTTPTNPAELLSQAAEHALKVLPGPIADLVFKEMRDGLWWLDKTKGIRPNGEVPEVAFDAVYGDKARAVLAMPVPATQDDLRERVQRNEKEND